MSVGYYNAICGIPYRMIGDISIASYLLHSTNLDLLLRMIFGHWCHAKYGKSHAYFWVRYCILLSDTQRWELWSKALRIISYLLACSCKFYVTYLCMVHTLSLAHWTISSIILESCSFMMWTRSFVVVHAAFSKLL